MFRRRRRLRWLLLALAAVALLAPSTSSLAVTAAERPITAVVAHDGNAYLGIEDGPIRLRNGNHDDVVLLEVTNHLTEPVDVSVSVRGNLHGPPPVVRDVTGITTLAVDETGAVTADIACGNASDHVDVFTVIVTASSRNTSIQVDETVTVTCTGNPPTNEADD
ncbi:MAG: hypothetical protein ABEJ57_02415 [Halobacteriaceae archaeon]